MENINPAAPAAPAPLTTVAAGPERCAKCEKPAEFTCLWPWGESEKVCALHGMLAQQTGQNLGREVTLVALPPPQNVPLTRDERSRLKGEVYALEEETKDLKARGLALYNENVELTRQLQSKHVRLQELESQLRDARGDLQTKIVELEESLATQGELADEVSRLRTLAKFTEPAGPSSLEP